MTKQVTEMKEENTLYKWQKIETKKDLPTIEDQYVVRIYESKMLMYFNGKRFESEEYKTPTHWLKPVEQPTDEEIEAIAEKEYPKANTEYKGVNAIIDLQQQSFIKGAKAMLQYKPENKSK